MRQAYTYSTSIVNVAAKNIGEFLEERDAAGWEFVTWLPTSREDEYHIVARRPA